MQISSPNGSAAETGSISRAVPGGFHVQMTAKRDGGEIRPRRRQLRLWRQGRARVILPCTLKHRVVLLIVIAAIVISLHLSVNLIL